MPALMRALQKTIWNCIGLKKKMTSTLTREKHLELYYYMRLNRDLEEQMVRLFRQNKIVGGLYSSFGQEAISVGTAYALGPGDWIAPMIRNIGALKSRHVVSPISMLGDLIPVMTGIAMAGRYLGQKIVTMTWIGDGGTSTGVFHEGLNLAAVQKAPLVLIVENNQWAYSTPVERQTPLRNLADRAKAYGIESAIVDGNDAVAVERTAREAVAHARAGHGPVLIEAKTMRMRGHAQHDAAEYVPKEMLEAWKKRDPLDRYEKFLNENKLWDAKIKKEIDARIAREIQADVEFAENSPFPPPELAGQGVYCEGCHTVEADWKRPKEEVMPPRSSVKPEWPKKLFVENGARPPAVNKVAAKSKPGKKTARVPVRAKSGS